MRINKYVALATGKSRREADRLISDSLISVNNHPVEAGYDVQHNDLVTMYGRALKLPESTTIVILNKPVGFVCSRDGQGSKTVYDLLPEEFHKLKIVGRLDKDSSGLLILTDDGNLAHRLTHPSFAKEKIYEIVLNKELSAGDKDRIETGVMLEDGESSLKLKGKSKDWTVRMYEGRNRQIRRTFEKLDYKVTKLHRTNFGPYNLEKLKEGSFFVK